MQLLLLCCFLFAIRAHSFKIRSPRISSTSLQVSTFRGAVRTVVQPLHFLGSLLRKAFSVTPRSDADLKAGIADFYDKSSSIWLDVWGQHLHHGYYPTSGYKDHAQAQVLMIDNALEFAYLNSTTVPKTMVDVGCGVGGSSRYIALKYGCSGRGVSLSPYQILRAKAFTEAQNLSGALQYSVNDAMAMPFADNAFDLTWSMESGEHMPDKNKFVDELVRVTTPGGRIVIVTWCHRELAAGETALKPREKGLLDKINAVYYLPDWVPPSKYVDYCKKLGLEDVRSEDWTEFIGPFWPAVFRSALVPRNFIRMLRSGLTVIRATIASLWMLRGFQTGVAKFAIITARKPTA